LTTISTDMKGVSGAACGNSRWILELDGYLYAFFIDNTGTDVSYSFSSDDGASWSAHQDIQIANVDVATKLHAQVYDGKIIVFYGVTTGSNDHVCKVGTVQGDGSLSFGSEIIVDATHYSTAGHETACVTANRIYNVMIVYDGSNYRIKVQYSTVADLTTWTQIMNINTPPAGGGLIAGISIVPYPDYNDVDSIMLIVSQYGSSRHAYNIWDNNAGAWIGWVNTPYAKVSGYGRVCAHYYDSKIYLFHSQYITSQPVYMGIWTHGVGWAAGRVTIDAMVGDRCNPMNTAICLYDDKIYIGFTDQINADHKVWSYDISTTVVTAVLNDTAYRLQCQIFYNTSENEVQRGYQSANGALPFSIDFADGVVTCEGGGPLSQDLFETLSFQEDLTKEIGFHLFDTFLFSDQISLNNIRVPFWIYETLFLSDSPRKNVGKTLGENLSFTDSYWRSIKKVLSESLSSIDNLLKSVKRILNESLLLTDILPKEIRKVLSGSLSFAGDISFRVLKKLYESLSSSVLFSFIKMIFLTFTETLGLEGSPILRVGLNLTETLILSTIIYPYCLTKIFKVVRLLVKKIWKVTEGGD